MRPSFGGSTIAQEILVVFFPLDHVFHGSRILEAASLLMAEQLWAAEKQLPHTQKKAISLMDFSQEQACVHLRSLWRMSPVSPTGFLNH